MGKELGSATLQMNPFFLIKKHFCVESSEPLFFFGLVSLLKRPKKDNLFFGKESEGLSEQVPNKFCSSYFSIAFPFQ